MNFVWPKEYLVNANEEFQAPLIDLDGFLKGNKEATKNAAKLISKACSTHGFFQVINHGVDLSLISEAYDQMDGFFKLPIDKKLSVRKMKGSMWGYSGAHADRFSSKLPWKETLSFPFHDNDTFEPVVTNYFDSTLGDDFQQAGEAFQKYCEAMKKLGMKVMEILAISLGVDKSDYYKYLFEDGCSIMRCNYYPSCQEPSVALGTGPHCDPTTLTILHQDQVGGLDVFADHKWQTVRPRSDAFVVNIGDTFTDRVAASIQAKVRCVWKLGIINGFEYHFDRLFDDLFYRAVVNRYKERRSLAFFLCPKDDKVLRPPQDIMSRDGTKQYPDFTWSQLLQFTQNYYRADEATLQNFIKWLKSSKTTNHLP
ncbi:hypothetical protein TSUD_32380 [Trifolium subterraneum]|uniref:Fe2OG dioxygenase domain-containing protein n=1 Tax=Trifolium subterraneum TaxID=3900 RepID=A0A2Z6LUB0_TRISU|nr:hypothetical protein TSUD_32380 [Trifolium subterraneum]